MSPTSDLEAFPAILREGHADWLAKHTRTAKLSGEHQQALVEETAADNQWKLEIVKYARTECLKIADLMQRKLPRELREYVYQYLCLDDRHIPIGTYCHSQNYVYFRGPVEDPPELMVGKDFPLHDFSEEIHFTVLPDGRLKEDHDNKPPADMLMPTAHIFNFRYLGRTIACEALEYYLSNNTFSVCDVDGSIHMFLRPQKLTDWVPHEVSQRTKLLNQMRHVLDFHTDISGLVRHLQIRVKLEHFYDLREQAMPRATSSDCFAFQHHFLREIRNSMSKLYLMAIDKTRQLDIEFILMTNIKGLPASDMKRQIPVSNLLLNLLETLRELIYTIMHRDLQLEGSTKVTVTHQDTLVSAFPRDLTALWGLTKDQWQYEERAREDTESYLLQLIPPCPRALTEEVFRRRWGVEDILKDTKPKHSVTEGEYWPILTMKNVGRYAYKDL